MTAIPVMLTFRTETSKLYVSTFFTQYCGKDCLLLFLWMQLGFFFQLCSADLFERHLKRSLSCAETQISNSYHCKTPDCIGWCEYEAEVPMGLLHSVELVFNYISDLIGLLNFVLSILMTIYLESFKKYNILCRWISLSAPCVAKRTVSPVKPYMREWTVVSTRTSSSHAPNWTRMLARLWRPFRYSLLIYLSKCLGRMPTN